MPNSIKDSIIKHKIIVTIFLVLFLTFFFVISFSKNQSSKLSRGPLLTNGMDGGSSNNNRYSRTDAVVQKSQKIYFVKKKVRSADLPPIIEFFTADITGENVTQKGKFEGFIKQIIPITETKYLFINNVGFLDRGTSIDIFDTTNQARTVVVSPTQGYQIDSFVVSEDKEKIVFWEVSIGATEEGISHIIYQEISNPSARKVLVDEPFSDVTKYPLYFSKGGKNIFLDSYSTKRNGDHRGIFHVSLDGVIQSVTALGLDQYSSAPLLSSDGQFLLYTSYNSNTKSKLDAPPVRNNLFRESIRNPNQIKRLNFISGDDEIIVENAEGGLFHDLILSADGKNSIYKYSLISEEKQILPQQYKSIDLTVRNENTYSSNTNGEFLYQFGDGKAIMGLRSEMTGSLGGLGKPNSPIFAGVYLYDPQNMSYSKILSDDPIQIIAIE